MRYIKNSRFIMQGDLSHTLLFMTIIHFLRVFPYCHSVQSECDPQHTIRQTVKGKPRPLDFFKNMKPDLGLPSLASGQCTMGPMRDLARQN